MRVSFTILKTGVNRSFTNQILVVKAEFAIKCKKIYRLKQKRLKKKRKRNLKDNKLLFLQIPSFIDYCT